MLSSTSRGLTYLTTLFYTLLGVLLFIFPKTLAPVFAWKVSDFITMTIGGWCLGNAWLAWVTVRRWNWIIVRSSLVYLWIFGILEILVLFTFREKVVLEHPIAWLYLITLTINFISAIFGFFDWLRIKPAYGRSGIQITDRERVLVVAFVLFAGFLGIYGVTAKAGAFGTNGGIFPETMSLFTLRSFGVFYLSLAFGVFPFVWDRNRNALLHHSFASFGFIILITLAAFSYLSLFDFAARPGGLLYFGAYIGIGIPLALTLRKFGTGY